MAEAFRDASAGYSSSQLQVVQAYSFILLWFAGHQMVVLRSSGGQLEARLVLDTVGSRAAQIALGKHPRSIWSFFEKF